MATSQRVVAISRPAAGDLSADQFKFVDVNASGQVAVVTADGGNSIGVLLNNPNGAGRASEVGVAGVVKVTAAAAIAGGARVASNGSGLARTAATGNHVLGRALEAATAANQVISVLLQKDGISA